MKEGKKVVGRGGERWDNSGPQPYKQEQHERRGSKNLQRKNLFNAWFQFIVGRDYSNETVYKKS